MGRGRIQKPVVCHKCKEEVEFLNMAYRTNNNGEQIWTCKYCFWDKKKPLPTDLICLENYHIEDGELFEGNHLDGRTKKIWISRSELENLNRYNENNS